MSLRKILMWILLVMSATTFAACGGGGSGGGPSGGGIGGSGKAVAVGPITGFGSVIVNGVEFETTGASITVDDDPSAVENDLRVGMVVKVTGSVDDGGTTGTADSIEFADNVEGPIDSIDVPSETLVVLGQTVVAADAVFDNATLDTLVVGNIVEVSGQPDATGAIRATRIERKADLFTPGIDEIEIKGTVSNLDPGAETFTINDLVVDFSGAETGDLADGQPANGQFVEVKSAQGVVGGQLVASKVEPEDDLFEFEKDAEVEIEGFVTDVTSGTLFEVSGQPVDATGAAFEGGTPGDIAVNVKVEVEGTIGTSGELLARKVEIKRVANVKIEAAVESKTANTVTLLGIEVRADDLTTEFDDSRDDSRPFSLERIEEGDWLEVRAFVDSDDNVIATRIERDDPEDEVLLQGTVDTASQANETLTILGVTVRTAGAEFENANDVEIPAGAFFDQLVVGVTVVKAKGTLVGGEIAADEVEIED